MAVDGRTVPGCAETHSLVDGQIADLPFYGIAMLSCRLAAGIVGLIAAIWQHERSWLVWLTMLPGLMVLIFVLGEFLVPH